MFLDEAGVCLEPTIVATWAPVGCQPHYPTDLRRRRVNLCGWVAPDEQRWGIERIERANSTNFLRVLPPLLDAFKDRKTITIILDNASWHKSNLTKEFVREHPQLNFWFLPPYSPELNVQEPQWRFMRRKVTHCRRFEDEEECWGVIQKHFGNLSSERIKTLCSLF